MTILFSDISSILLVIGYILLMTALWFLIYKQSSRMNLADEIDWIIFWFLEIAILSLFLYGFSQLLIKGVI